MYEMNDTPNPIQYHPGSACASRRRTHRLCQDDPFRRRAALFPQAGAAVGARLKLFALHAADGTPIMLTDSREAAIANAWSQELETVSVH